MYRHHDYQNTGQEQYTTSINNTSERCIPIKRRLLNKFYSSIQTASTQPNERNLVANADLSRHSVDQVEQSEALDLRKAKKARICTSPDFKWESAALPGKTRPELQSKKPVLEQCLRGVDCRIARPALQKVLQYHDHYKLSIGERTKLDKMLDDELLAKYFESERTYSPGRAESPGRRPQGNMLSTLSYDREPHWDGHNSLGLRLSNKSSRTNAFGRSCGTTLTRQHQPREVQNEVGSVMLKDLGGMGNGLSTISVADLWAPSVTSESLTSENHIPSLATSQSDDLQQLGNNGIATNEFLSRTALKQPKRERDLAVQFCQRTQSHCSVSSEELRTIEVEKRRNEITNIVVKSEADTCSVIGNEQPMTPATKNEIDQEATAIGKTPADGKCPICSDVVSGYHYGTRSCESCKGFFKRTIQNKRNERLACAVAGNCVINLQNRKHCAYCRYKKCLEAGMKNEAVREDRQRGGRSMYEGSSEQRRRLQLQHQNEALGQTKKRKPRKRAPSTATQPPAKDQFDPSLETVRTPLPQTPRHKEGVDPSVLSASPTIATATSKPSTSTESGDSCEEFVVLLKKMENLETTFFNPFGLPRISIDRSNSEKSLLTGGYYLMDHFCKKMPSWIEMMPHLQDLEVGDRSVLLKANWLQVLILTICFRCHDNEGHLILPDRSRCDLMSMVNSVAILDIVRRMKQLAQKFQALKTTQDEYFYLKLLILLNPDAKNLSQPSRVRSYQERVQENLFDLGMAREGISAGMKIGELLLKLSELERLSHLIKEHLVFTQVAGQLGPRNYSNLENMLEDD